MNSNLAQENVNAACAPSTSPDWLRLAPALVIMAAAFAYYGSYWHYWFNPHDEGGTACLVTQRLLQGERPWIDFEPGYNIGWYYPLIGLFKITGVNYLAARAWFFTLSTITALLGYFTVTRVSGSRLLGLGVGLALITLPGSQFKNYIPFVQAANTACLIALVYVPPGATRRWFGTVALGGVVLGLTYLLRIEIGFFFSTIWLGVILLTLLDRRAAVGQRCASALVGLVCLIGGLAVAQTPAYLHLRSRGLDGPYLNEYSRWFGFLRTSLMQEVLTVKQPGLADATNPPPSKAPVSTPEPASSPTTVPAAAAAAPATDDQDRTLLVRRPFSETWTEKGRKRLLPFLTYAPFIGFGVVLFAGLAAFLRALWRREYQLNEPALLWLLLAGVSLTTFPQFFFFRPDRPHLSEFMPGFIVSMAAAVGLLWKAGLPPMLRKIFAGALTLFLALHFATFATFAMQHPSAGTIAARTGRKLWFHGENGVNLRCSKREAAKFQLIHDVVRQHSRDGDYLICFPYMPGFNVLTNRPTYLRNVYVDNATRSDKFSADTIRDFEQKQPAVVIVDDRAINGADASRLSRWAPEVFQYLKAHYTPAGKFEAIEIFVRPAAEQ